MKTPFSWPLLADENINPGVIKALRQAGYSITSVNDHQLTSHTDIEILRFAYNNALVVLTHDSDFGTLALAQNEPFCGIIFLRPGHIDASYTLEMLHAIEREAIKVTLPFILVVMRRGDSIRIRRRLF